MSQLGARSWRLPAAGAVLLALVAACGSSPASPSASSLGNKPTVVVQSPVNGAVVGLGQDVTVAGAANDTVGVDHVALFADGVSVASTPSAAPTALVPFSLTWLATPAGPHVLQVIAYRADGTPSDPAVVNLVVGASGSGLPVGSGLFSFPVASSPGGLITPAPSKKPKPSKTPTMPPTTPPSTTPTSAPTDTPTAAPTGTPGPTGTPLPTPASDGTAPDDSTFEPHHIDVEPTTTNCPADPNAPPVVAVGCVWEQISAPAGDSTDALDFIPLSNASYQLYMTSCSDVSGQTTWGVVGDPPGTTTTGCNSWEDEVIGATAPATTTIVITFAAAPVQLYNLYQFTVYQCQFFNCGTQ